MNSEPIRAACHCGAVRLNVAKAPADVTSCNCSICRRYGVVWAYYPLAEVRINDGATDVYSWDDRSIEFHRCRNCGCVSHWAPVDKTSDRMGVNARLMEPEVLAVARLRRLDGACTERYVDE
jgi:hypothetical protein